LTVYNELSSSSSHQMTGDNNDGRASA